MAANTDTALKLFVSLPVKPESLEKYLKLTLAEVNGARSEEGCSAFFAYQDSTNPTQLYLFEHWNSEDWLFNVHADKDYYKEMRGVEAEVLDGEVGERFLTEIVPNMPLPIATTPVGFARVTVFKDSNGVVAKQFASIAENLRKANGNLGVWLFADTKVTGEYLLLEHWQSEATASQAKTEINRLFAAIGNSTEVVVLKDILS